MPDARLKKTREAYADNRTPTERREDEERAARDREQDQRGKVLAIRRDAFEIAMAPLDGIPMVIEGVGYFREDWNVIEGDHHPLDEQ